MCSGKALNDKELQLLLKQIRQLRKEQKEGMYKIMRELNGFREEERSAR